MKNSKLIKFKSNVMHTDPSLQITSMADIFMIILVFLLKGYGSGAVSLQVSKGMALPVAESAIDHAEALKIEIAKDSVLVEGEPVVAVTEGRIAASEISKDGVVKSLSDALLKLKQKRQALTKIDNDLKDDSQVIVLADKAVTMQLLRPILTTATISGFSDFKLGVVKKE